MPACGVALMAPQYHCFQSKIPFPIVQNNRQLLEKAITLERKGIFTITTFCELSIVYGEFGI